MRLSRRSVLSSTLAGAAFALGGCAAGAATPGRSSPQGDRLVLLGTRGGPGWSVGRLGIGSALCIGDAVYVIDVGDGAARQLALALDPELTDGHAFEGVRAIFLTHLHSDHVADYFTLLAYGGGRGLGGGGAIPVLGPGRRGALQPAVAQQLAGEPEPPVIHPENPTPGTVDMTQSLMAGPAAMGVDLCVVDEIDDPSAMGIVARTQQVIVFTSAARARSGMSHGLVGVPLVDPVPTLAM